MYKGIDVSEHQGTINWKKVKAAGCRFAILRAMKQNGKADIQFLANARGCQENGIPYEVYRYTYAHRGAGGGKTGSTAPSVPGEPAMQDMVGCGR